MARAALTGGMSGAMNGLSGIPERFITGLKDHERLLKLAEKVAELTGCYLHFNDIREDPDKRNYFVSFERIQEAGFTPEVRWEQGLAALHEGLETLRWPTSFANVEYY